MPNQQNRSFFRSHGDVVLPLLVAVFLSATVEGLVAVFSILGRNGSFVEALFGLISGGGLVVALLLPGALGFGWLASRKSSRELGRGFVRGLSGTDEGGGAAVVIVLAVAVLIVLTFGALLGRSLAMAMTPFFSSFALVAVTVVLVPIALLCVAPVVRILKVQTDKIPWTSNGTASAAVCLVSFLILTTASLVLPSAWVLFPAALILGVGLGLHPLSTKLFDDKIVKKKRAGLVLVVLIAWSIGTLCTVHWLPDGTKQSLLYDTKYAGTFLDVLGSALDKDNDGFSGLFLGGDCNDSDPRINPNARDIPSNGIDENCSGLDAIQYVPPTKPGFELPKNLEGTKTNIVFILVDALRPDHIGAAGYHRPTTPRIDGFIKDSLWFQNAYTPAPRTQSAMTSLFTGKDIRATPHRKGSGNRFTLKSKAVTMAEILKQQGYDTVGYTISYVIQHKKGLGQGFRVWRTPWATDQWRKAFSKSGKLTTNAAIGYLKEKKPEEDKPFFLFTHYRCTHDPYYKHKPWDFGDRPVDRYDSALAYCDQEIGRLLDEIDARSDADRTAVFILSDHGELFGDHGYEYHGFSLYEADVRVLLSAKIPGVEPKTVSQPVSLSDIPNTILSLAGDNDIGGEGFNLLSYANDTKVPSRPLFMFTDLRRGKVRRNISAVLSWPYKYIHDKRSRKKELYNVEQDPGESDDLSKKANTKRAQLAEILESFEANLREQLPQKPVPRSE